LLIFDNLKENNKRRRKDMDSYLVAITPDESVIKIVNEYRQKYARYTEYKIPPHITIYPPFYLKKIPEEGIRIILQNAVGEIKKKRITLGSINYFRNTNNNVVYFELNPVSASFVRGVFLRVFRALNYVVNYAHDDYVVTADNFNAHLTIAEKIPEKELEIIKSEIVAPRRKLFFRDWSVDLYKKKCGSKTWKIV